LKIDCDEALFEWINLSLSYLMVEEPIEVYAIALDLLRTSRKPLSVEVAKGVEAIAREACRRSLLRPALRGWTPELSIKRDDYTRLGNYSDECADQLAAFLKSKDLIRKTGDEWVWYNAKCGVCPPASRRMFIPRTALGDDKYPTAWWAEYWEMAVRSAKRFPCKTLFMVERAWEPTLWILARKCPTCHRAAAKEYPLFREKLMKEIAKVIASVRTPPPLRRLIHL
jgi:hypothetical protein